MIKEFVCPNGRMSVNGVCPIFEGDDGQIKDFNKTKKTFDEKYESIEDIEKDRNKDILEFDFMKPTESAFESAGNIISNNLKAYDSFVENKLGIPANVQNFLTIGSAAVTGSLIPFAIPFVAGAALNNQAQKEQEAAINRESVRDLQGRIDKGEFGSNTPTPQDKARTDYGGRTQSRDSIGSRGSGMSGYGGGADMGGGSPGSSGPGGSDEMGSF